MFRQFFFGDGAGGFKLCSLRSASENGKTGKKFETEKPTVARTSIRHGRCRMTRERSITTPHAAGEM